MLPGDGSRVASLDNNGKNKNWSSPAGYEITGQAGVIEDVSGTDDSIDYSQPSKYSVSTSILRPFTAIDFPSGSYNYLNLWDATLDYTDTTLPQSGLDKVPDKTVYDPSPPGFSVPRRNYWTGFRIKNSYGNYARVLTIKGDSGWDCGRFFMCNETDEIGIFIPANFAYSRSFGEDRNPKEAGRAQC